MAAVDLMFFDKQSGMLFLWLSQLPLLENYFTKVHVESKR